MVNELAIVFFPLFVFRCRHYLQNLSRLPLHSSCIFRRRFEVFAQDYELSCD
jgi:hypothetical protein